METPLSRYEKDLSAGYFSPDAAQNMAVKQLDRLFHELVAAEHDRQGFSLSKLAFWRHGTQAGVKGIYLWGGVGRGKTVLMDLFYETVPFEVKMRTHFHRFMREVHESLTRKKGQKNPLDEIADEIAAQYRLMCFDEFFVTDITDAMILGNLFKRLFEKGIVLVATSNIEPERLYENGLQRERFLPAIELLVQKTQIINVDGQIDYRLRNLSQAELYHTPLNAQTSTALMSCFKALVPEWATFKRDAVLNIEGRPIQTLFEMDDVVWFHFAAVCDGPRSQHDYIVLAREYHTVVVSGVPIFNGDNDDQARRFIYLVDEFYDRKVKLILSAAAPITALYQKGRLSFEFERTQSRLLEMQSEAYLALPHKA